MIEIPAAGAPAGPDSATQPLVPAGNSTSEGVPAKQLAEESGTADVPAAASAEAASAPAASLPVGSNRAASEPTASKGSWWLEAGSCNKDSDSEGLG